MIAAALTILRERGASRLTTKEVAARAGVSEGSVFYHFTDRAGLLLAVMEDGLAPLQALHGDQLPGDSVHDSLKHFATALEQFLNQGLVAMIAAQSDSELRAALGEYMIANNLGPHRGVEAVTSYLTRQQKDGNVRDDIDPAGVAVLLIGACFLRVSQRQMIDDSYGKDLPDLDDLVALIDTLVTPTVRAARARARTRATSTRSS
jgi:AcrR family transcriptional regulator